MITRHEIIKTIVEQSSDNPNVMNSIIGTAIVDACKKSLNTDLDLQRVKALIDSASFIINQIELSEKFIEMSHSSLDIEAYQRCKRKQIESLQKCINQL